MDMEGPVNFTQDNRKEVSTFFTNLLNNYKEPIYYEYIRGHVSKATSVVRKYVASKLKGEKLLEYFKLRKNYYIVEGTDVLLIKDSYLQRKRVKSECAAEVTRERRKRRISDTEYLRRSYSISSDISDNTIASSSASCDNFEKKLEHEDYVNKYFCDLVARHVKIIPSSLDYDDLPKKVKRYLDLYCKKKVANYFANFSDKFCFDKEGNVSFKIHDPSSDSSIPLESCTVDTKISSNSADVSLPSVNTTKKADSPIDHEIQYRYNGIEAILFFTDILIKKKTSLTVDQLGGYLSQAPKELRTFLKLNFNMLKKFFEEYSVIFYFNSYGEVTLCKSTRNSKLIIEKMKRIVSKALTGNIPVLTMKEELYSILHPVSSDVSEKDSELAEHFDTPIIDIKDRQANSCITPESVNKLNFIEVLNDKKDAENGTVTCLDKFEGLAATSKYSEDTSRETDVKSNGMDSNNSISETFNTKSNIQNNSSVKVEAHQNSSKIDEMSVTESDVDPACRKLLEFFLTFELFCLEMTEKDFEFTVSNELNVIQYFIEVLSEPTLKDWSLNALHGTIGKASADVSSFLKKKYKGDKFASFFQKQTEFVVDGPFVKLSSSYQETFSKRLTTLSVSVNQNSKWDLLKLYESKCYKDVSNEVCALLNDICIFLENKSKTKLSRLEGIVTRFPNCLEWINALEGAALAEKIGRFLGLFSIFEILDEDHVYFSQKEFCDTIKRFFEKTIQNERIDSDAVERKFFTIMYKLSEDSCYLLKKSIINKIPTRYCKLVKFLPTSLLLEINNGNTGTKKIIDALLETGEFFFQNGKIDLKSEQNLSFCLKNGTDSSLMSNEKFGSPIESFTNNGNVLKSSTGSNTTSQQTEDSLYVHCTNCKSTYEYTFDEQSNSLCDDSYTLSDVSQPLTPVKIFSDSSNCYKNQLELSNSELAKCNSQNLNSKEEIETKDKDLQILSHNINANETDLVVSEEDHIPNLKSCLHSSECNDSVDVFENLVSQNIIECDNEEDYDSLVAEVDSINNLSEAHSISSLEDELAYTYEEHMKTPNANEIIAEIRGFEDACVSSQLLASYEENKLLSKDVKLKETNMSSPTTVQYIDLLNEELPDIHENMDANKNISFVNKTFLNQLLIESEALLAYQIEAKPPCKQNVSDMLHSDENEYASPKVKATDFKIDGHKFENITEMKHKAELLAKEVFQNNFHNMQQSKIFVACTTAIFLFKKNYLSKKYGPLICTEKEKSKNLSETIPINNKASISSNDADSLNNLKSTVNESLSHGSDIPTEVTSLDVSQPNQNSCLLNISLSDCKGVQVEYPLQQEFDSTNQIKETEKSSSINAKDAHDKNALPEKVDSTNSSNLDSTLDDEKLDPSEYPLQPILAEVVLLTADSCIAVAKIKSRKQNIYFLKCVFVCEHQYCCSDCFNDLKVSDIVSCFIPPTEMSRKMWIAIMVSKETSTQFEEIDSFNEVLRKQNDGGCMNRNMCVNSKSVSIQTESPGIEFSSNEQACQTHLCGDVKLCAITENSMSQTNVSVKSASIQTENETKSSECQTNFPLDRCNVESQTNYTGDIKETPTCADVLCQTEDVKPSINVVNTESQTISTGQVMVTRYYHM